MGNDHDSFGIKMIRESIENKYEIMGEVEGWEYLINPIASSKYEDELRAINDELSKLRNIEDFEEYQIPDNIRIIQAEPLLEGFNITSRVIILSNYSQYIINKYSTKQYLGRIDEINDDFN